MKKTLMMILSIYFALNVYAQNDNASKVVEVTNYQEVVSSIPYPTVCKEKGIEGRVIVSLEIDEDGNLTSHEFLSFPCSDLRDVVFEALEDLEFKAATNNSGQAIASRITMPVNFELSI